MALLDSTILTTRRCILETHLKSRPGGLTRWQWSSGCRRSHQTAVTSFAPSEPRIEDSRTYGANSVNSAMGLPVLRHGRRTQGVQKVKELELKVQALEDAIKTDALPVHSLTFSEDELMSLYEDVLQVDLPQNPQQDDPVTTAAIEKSRDLKLVRGAHRRLCSDLKDERPPYQQILARVYEIVSRAQTALGISGSGSSQTPSLHLSLGILSIAECEALIRTSLKENDTPASEIILEFMKRDNMKLPEKSLTSILKCYADAGQIELAENFVAKYISSSPTEAQRHLHVRAHLKACSLESIPTSALEVLHKYEEKHLAAPMPTYTSVISALLSRPSSLARAQAWDVYSHMRYVAHPTPDALLYALMIRACASPVSTRHSSEPEKALDLWTEMTVDQKIQPTAGSYNAVILACARSGTKTYVNEAFRLARQMLDSTRDARGYTPFRPDRKTFCALLEGAKRLGDLGRARWILAEMVKLTSNAQDKYSESTAIDEEIMMHVFHAYASYNVPRQPKLVQSTKEPSPPQNVGPTAQHAQSDRHQAASSPVATEQPKTAGQSFAHLPPKTRGDVIREVKALFERILHDRQSTPSSTTSGAFKTFSKVEPSARLLNSYLSVYYKHAQLEDSQTLFWKLCGDYPALHTPRTFVEALERCANARRGQERAIATKFCSDLWAEWVKLETSLGDKLPARLIERAHAAMVRLLTITDQLDHALSHLRLFASNYPPGNVRIPTPKSHLRSTRTSLFDSRPLVRMTSAAEVPDDHVPPLLTFKDVEVLHHRLIDEYRTEDIKYVTWLCKAYEWALRVRRDETIKAKPLDQPTGLVDVNPLEDCEESPMVT